MKQPRYLGDGVYIQVDPKSGQFILTTSSHIFMDADDTIFLEPEIAQALVNYITQPE